jgi:predicted small secreted protein
MKRSSNLIAVLLLACAAVSLSAQLNTMKGTGCDVDNILSQRRQAEVINEYVAWRLDNVLPQIMRREGIEGSIYTHPIGYYGHGSGMMLGMVEKQSFVPGTGERPLFPNTSYSIELSASHVVPEWGNTRVSMGLEDEALFT